MLVDSFGLLLPVDLLGVGVNGSTSTLITNVEQKKYSLSGSVISSSQQNYIYDKVGNVRQSPTWTFYVDWEAPTTFTLISPADNETVTTSRPAFKWHSS